MLHCLRALRPVLPALALLSGSVAAQSVERPVAFDSAGRVLTISPRFVSRFKVSAALPITGPFVEARLFTRPEGGFVLVVQREDGSQERTPLSATERTALSQAIDQALSTVGGVATIGEGASILSEPAGGAFTRNLTIAAAGIWGPSISALINDYPAAAAGYLATVGAAFFTTSAIARSTDITRAQNHLATDGALRGAALGSGLAYVIRDESRGSGRGTAFSILAGSVIATGVGFVRGHALSDGEANGVTWGSTYAAGLTAGAIGLAGGWNSSRNKGEVAGVMLGGLLGYPAGLAWVRRSRYSITAGDVGAIRTASVVGTLGAAILLGDDPGPRLVTSALSGGMVLGSLIGARALARPYDLTESQATQITLGALAGGLIGVAMPTLAQADDGRAYAGAGAIGAAIGMGVTSRMVRLRPGAGRASTARDARITLTPWNALALATTPGRAGDPTPRRASLVRVAFR